MITDLLSPQIKATLKSIGAPWAPRRLRANYRKIGPSASNKIVESLKEHYFSQGHPGQTREEYLASILGKNDLEANLHLRTDEDRANVIPWLDQARRLTGARILEIGCGTGSSTVAFAEQGANITAVDVDELSLKVARDRCEVYGLKADFLALNATQVAQHFAGERFDFIIFYASLEHMTHEERMVAMRSTWDMLPKDSYWCVVEAPNRLWHSDPHTSLLPFFHWLPDDVAFEYSRFSPRDGFRTEFRERSDAAQLQFFRQGRGVSYHEFDLAIRPSQQLNVVSSLLGFLRRRSLLWLAKAQIDGDLRFESFIAKVGPPIHKGFFHSRLDLIIKKD